MFDYKKILPQRLLYYREKYDLTQDEIAKQLGISQSTYANWERGFRAPRANEIAWIADIYQIPLDDLFGRTDIKKD